MDHKRWIIAGLLCCRLRSQYGSDCGLRSPRHPPGRKAHMPLGSTGLHLLSQTTPYIPIVLLGLQTPWKKPKRCWGPHGFNYGLRAPPYPPRLAWIADSGRKACVFWGPHGFNCGLRPRHKRWLKHPPRLPSFGILG